jgi:aspartate carbamoyltransferase catalytic subunit
MWGMNDSRLRRLPSTSIVMHPGPMNRGLEISGSVADSPQSTVTEQVANGVALRMAVLYTLMGDSR